MHTPKELYDFYQIYEDGEDRSKTFGYKIRNFFVSELMGKPASVLDVGCGHGHFLSSLKEDIEPKVGVDIVKVPLNEAKRRSVSVVLADAHLLPFRDQTFKLVTSREVIEHLVAPYNALEEWMRVSSKGIIISSPVTDGYKTCNAILFFLWKARNLMTQRQRRNLTEEQRLSKDSGHISAMTRMQILNLLGTNKQWKIEKTVFFLKTPMTLVLDRKSFPKQLRKLILRIEILVTRIPAQLSELLLFEGFAVAVKFTRVKEFSNHGNKNKWASSLE
jgi:ubiquinone/menaquinone biosynthesis C-methylase UbiE